MHGFIVRIQTSILLICLSFISDNGAVHAYFHDNQCDFRCRVDCLEVNGTCSRCYLWKWGAYCEYSCPKNCRFDCDRLTGVCTDCLSGFYGSNCKPCPEHCKEGCDRLSGNCLVCPKGRYGPTCTDLCDHCKTSCNRVNGVCEECEDGYFGKKCNESCPDHCAGKCNRGNGECNICKSGWYGRNCTVPCQQQCQANTTCDQITGLCESCSQGLYRYSTENKTCDKTCLNTCLDRSCQSTSGYCNVCVNRKYGAGPKQCTLDCSYHCFGECDRDTGSCFACNAWFYGQRCDKLCSRMCIDACERDGQCFTCSPGYSGWNCEEKCPVNCYGPCDQMSKSCLLCKTGYYGSTCENTCPDHCTSGCHKFDGNCDGLNGPACNISCLHEIEEKLESSDTNKWKQKTEREQKLHRDLSAATKVYIKISAIGLSVVFMILLFTWPWCKERLRVLKRRATVYKEHEFENKGFVCEKDYQTDFIEDEPAQTYATRPSPDLSETRLTRSHSARTTDGSSYLSVEFGEDMVLGMTTSLAVNNHNNENETDIDILSSASQSPALSETRLKRCYSQYSPNASQRSSGGSSLLSVHFGKPRIKFESSNFQAVGYNGDHINAPCTPEGEDLTISGNSSPVSRARSFERDSQRSSRSSSHLSVTFGP